VVKGYERRWRVNEGLRDEELRRRWRVDEGIEGKDGEWMKGIR
jgi:hypothetical protein